MQKITCIIAPHELDALKWAVRDTPNPGMTVSAVHRHRQVKPIVHRGHAYRVDYVPRLKVEMVVPDDQVAIVQTAVRSAVKNAESILSVTPVEQVIKIRTGETGDTALRYE